MLESELRLGPVKIAVRVDASVQMGLGHLTRCLALAAALRTAGAEVLFVTRDLGLDAAARIRAQGFDVSGLPAPDVHSGAMVWDGPAHAHWAQVPFELDASQTTDAVAFFQPQWCVVDSYSFDARWHRTVAAATGAKVCVIDDLADRPLQAHLLVDHNLAADHRVKYASVGAGVQRQLCGPRFALLAPAYEHAAGYNFQPQVRSMGIFMGGTDPGRLSELVLRACRQEAQFDGLIQIVATRAHPCVAALQAACERAGHTELLLDLPDLADFFSRHDLHIGAGGGALWERCCMGAPTLALVCAQNQEQSIGALSAAGVVASVAQNTVQDIGQAARRLIDHPHERHLLHERALALVDGRGAQRVALALMAECIELVRAQPQDAAVAYPWRNDARTRQFFRDPSPVARHTHDQWWSAVLASAQRELFALRCGSVVVGFVRLDHQNAQQSAAGPASLLSLYLDPALIGLGLGTAALRATQRWVRQHGSAPQRLDAEVLCGNLASERAFEAAGFVQTRPGQWSWEPGVQKHQRMDRQG